MGSKLFSRLPTDTGVDCLLILNIVARAGVGILPATLPLSFGRAISSNFVVAGIFTAGEKCGLKCLSSQEVLADRQNNGSFPGAGQILQCQCVCNCGSPVGVSGGPRTGQLVRSYGERAVSEVEIHGAQAPLGPGGHRWMGRACSGSLPCGGPRCWT
jgi:hypothetical protein